MALIKRQQFFTNGIWLDLKYHIFKEASVTQHLIWDTKLGISSLESNCQGLGSFVQLVCFMVFSLCLKRALCPPIS